VQVWFGAFDLDARCWLNAFRSKELRVDRRMHNEWNPVEHCELVEFQIGTDARPVVSLVDAQTLEKILQPTNLNRSQTPAGAGEAKDHGVSQVN
jgi:hypothetical protein